MSVDGWATLLFRRRSRATDYATFHDFAKRDFVRRGGFGARNVVP